MESIILCEGYTDAILLQYYMREVFGWEDDSDQNGVIVADGDKNNSRRLFKNSDGKLTIVAVGGVSKFEEIFNDVLDRNCKSQSNGDDAYKKIVLITDRDDNNSEEEILRMVLNVMTNYDVYRYDDVSNNCWCRCSMENSLKTKIDIQFLLLMIPFEENGSLETFLLKAISLDNPYDGGIIKGCEKFVQNIDPAQTYLKHRRDFIKAEFDTYFSIRTSAEQFTKRQDIIKSVKWDEYNKIQEDFCKLGDI